MLLRLLMHSRLPDGTWTWWMLGHQAGCGLWHKRLDGLN
jgi:hypothetical protein